MTDKPNNPPFHPQAKWAGQIGKTEGGATLRDHFAGHALAAGIVAEKDDLLSAKYEYLARDAYLFADAMLAERGEADPLPDLARELLDAAKRFVDATPPPSSRKASDAWDALRAIITKAEALL